MDVKAVGFDLFGTLIEAKADVNECISSMSTYLYNHGFSINDENFTESYRSTILKYRKIRRENLREVNNRIWLCDTLNNMGYDTEATDPVIVSAVESYFSLWQLSVFPEVPESLKRISQRFKTGLISNFTDSGFLLRTLNKLCLNEYFDSIAISDSVGWRKPHPRIFKYFLDSLGVEAKESIYIGDDPDADIKGAQDYGIKAVLILRQENDRKK